MGQKGFFDVERRLEAISAKGDPLETIKKIVPWEDFRAGIEAVTETKPEQRKSNAGRKPYDTILKLKIVVLQSLHNLSDERTEYLIRDRISFMRFLDLELEDPVPDATTIWLFREALAQAGLIDRLFERFGQHLEAEGYIARGGQIIDATIVSVPKQRNTKEENEAIKAGKTPEGWEQQPANAGGAIWRSGQRSSPASAPTQGLGRGATGSGYCAGAVATAPRQVAAAVSTASPAPIRSRRCIRSCLTDTPTARLRRAASIRLAMGRRGGRGRTMRNTSRTSKGLRLRTGIAAAVVVLGIAGCGDSDSGDDPAKPAEPAVIPAEIGRQLAARSDEVEVKLDAGDVCGAAHEADELAREVEKAGDRIPAELRDELEAGTEQLVNTVNCPPPPKPEKEKKDKDKGDDEEDEEGGYGDEEIIGEGDGDAGPGNSEDAPGHNKD